MANRCILILGGARSGKSRFAQEMAARLGEKVLFVATGEALDEEMSERIAAHKRTRPSTWRTLEAPLQVGERIQEQMGDAQVVVVDCLTLLVANVMGTDGSVDLVSATEKASSEVSGLIDCIEHAKARFILVSNEVGLGLVPDSPLGRAYRDLLGRVNEELARQADTVYFMVAGIPVIVKGPGGDTARLCGYPPFSSPLLE